MLRHLRISLTFLSGFNHDDRWGHRANEPNKAVICSVALARLRTDIRGNDLSSNAVGMAQKLLLFWRKPARRCWWEGVELENVDGVEGKLKIWIRRVWTLEMVSNAQFLSTRRIDANHIKERHWSALTDHHDTTSLHSSFAYHFGWRTTAGLDKKEWLVFMFSMDGKEIAWRLDTI